MVKTTTFAVMHFGIAFSVAYLLTGDIVIGGALALIEPAVNTVAFYFHERIWQRLGHRRSRFARFGCRCNLIQISLSRDFGGRRRDSDCRPAASWASMRIVSRGTAGPGQPGAASRPRPLAGQRMGI